MPIVTRSRSKSIQQELTAIVAPAMALPVLSPIPASPLSASASTHSYGISGCSTLTSLSQLSAALHRYSPESGHSASALGVVAQARANIGEHSTATPVKTGRIPPSPLASPGVSPSLSPSTDDDAFAQHRSFARTVLQNEHRILQGIPGRACSIVELQSWRWPAEFVDTLPEDAGLAIPKLPHELTGYLRSNTDGATYPVCFCGKKMALNHIQKPKKDHALKNTYAFCCPKSNGDSSRCRYWILCNAVLHDHEKEMVFGVYMHYGEMVHLQLARSFMSQQKDPNVLESPPLIFSGHPASPTPSHSTYSSLAGALGTPTPSQYSDEGSVEGDDCLLSHGDASGDVFSDLGNSTPAAAEGKGKKREDLLLQKLDSEAGTPVPALSSYSLSPKAPNSTSLNDAEEDSSISITDPLPVEGPKRKRSPSIEILNASEVKRLRSKFINVPQRVKSSKERLKAQLLTRAQARAALKLRIPAYNLETALRQEEERRRQDAELCGEDIYDEDVELESDELEIEAQNPIPTIARPSSETHLPAPSSPLSSSSLSASSTLLKLDTASQPRNILTTLPPSRNEIKEQRSRLLKKKADKRRKGRAKRAETSQMRQASYNLKPLAVQHAREALPARVPSFDAASLPVASTAFIGRNGSLKLSPGLQWILKNLALLSAQDGMHLYEWNGQTCVVLVDCCDRIIAVLGGVPPSACGAEWDGCMERLAEAVQSCKEKSTFTAKETIHARGDFIARAAGISYGGGREQPGNVRIGGKTNQEAMKELLEHEDMLRLVGFTNALFNAYGHRTFVEYTETLQQHLERNPHLRPTSSNTAFAATTVNYGPQTCAGQHRDAGNTAHGWCADTSLGKFDPDKGGHLVLWDLKLIIRFPPGATVLFPSALITHSNLPVQSGETRYSIIQYSSGGLFRWRYNGWCSDKAFLSAATPNQLRQREHDRTRRWQLNLQKFTQWSDLLEGDWQGKRRADAALYIDSELTDRYKPMKKPKHHCY
ncbi:hypothetical protein F5879DRAFT_988876 [Lentinula edodes]|nr:hypothetical protein F5879DRAFT_988876 [Lentinula edodes]